jgi:hypothetical protein
MLEKIVYTIRDQVRFFNSQYYTHSLALVEKSGTFITYSVIYYNQNVCFS